MTKEEEMQIPEPVMYGECSVLAAKEGDKWHLSIAHRSRYPTLDEIRDARYKFVPDDVTMAMIYPPKDEYVNLHNNCFHLWQVKL